jgi:histidinol-phosphate aminotransferase
MDKELALFLQKVRQPFNINSMAQVAALTALQDIAYLEQTIARTISGRKHLMMEISRFGCKCYPSETNFFLVGINGEADTLYAAMLHKGVIVRSMRPYGFPDCIRITVGTEEENHRLLSSLYECLNELKYV